MDSIKKLTGKNPSEYELVAKNIIDNSDINLYMKLIKQDDFLFDFVKRNVAKRLQNACTKENYMNVFNFFKYYSPSYDTVFAEVLYKYGGINLLPKIKEIFLEGNDAEKSYALKFFSFVPPKELEDIIDKIRTSSEANNEYLVSNAIEILSYVNDDISKNNAINKLKSVDEFEQYEGVKFLVMYQAKDCIEEIAKLMKTSSMSENIAYELMCLVDIEELMMKDFELANLLLINVINAIPEIIPISIVLDWNFYSIFENLYINNLNSVSSVLLQIAKDKFEELNSNDEYLFDCDKNTKDEVKALNQLLQGMNKNKLQSFMYDELYEESDFVMFAIDFVEDVEMLESLLDSKNPTLLLKILSILKMKNCLKSTHKEIALKNLTLDEHIKIIEAL